tara:strand:- start:219 stop:494 length:276 start_codon:yes stop_codon:yes gene_type:complete
VKPADIFQELEHIAGQLNICIIYEKGNFNGGYCILEEERIIVINRLKSIEQRIRSLAQAFARLYTSQIYLKPTIREMIEMQGDSLQLFTVK